MATKEYELLADRYHETTSKPGEPFTYKEYKKGDPIKLDAEQAERLIAAGAVADPSDTERQAAAEEKPEARRKRTQTTAPKGEADEALAPEGTVGQPEPKS